MELSFVSWNMDHWKRTEAQRRASWTFLAHLAPDVALVQEAVPSCDAGTARVFRAGGIGPKRPWGSAIVSYGPALGEIKTTKSPSRRIPHDVLRTHPGSVAIATVSAPGAPIITAISLYGLIDEGYAVTTVHRQLSDLTPLFDDSSLNHHMVLAGDLNISTQLKEPDRSRHRGVLERIAGFDLVNCLSLNRPARQGLLGCPCSDAPCTHVRTQRHGKSGVPWHNDYFFVTQRLKSHVATCAPIDSGEPDPWSFSDHCPIRLALSFYYKTGSRPAP